MVDVLSRPPAAAQFRATDVSRTIRDIAAPTKVETKARWLRAVAARVSNKRPDLADDLLDLLRVEPLDIDPLQDRTIGEIGVCYEALLAGMNAGSRRSSGQYFTPDDAAEFMARRSTSFPEGTWMDPCCGVGNLAWHLANVQEDPAEFVRNRLILIDRDEDALRSAVAILAADYLAEDDRDGFAALRARAERRDFLSHAPLPVHDFVIVNPPYAREAVLPGYETGAARELFAYFIERIAKTSRGFISVTPASYLSVPKFRILRHVISQNVAGGEVFVFDNVPDTLFRGYKFGSSNTSKTNFVRAAITVANPQADIWETTPIIRWKSISRRRMFEGAESLLTTRRFGPDQEWAKLAPGVESVWDELVRAPETIASLKVNFETKFQLTVALTPRYFISAAFCELNRSSKAVLYFGNEEDRDRAALVLNSSIPYLWWRALDGGVTLSRRVLDSTPVPLTAKAVPSLIACLKNTESDSIVTKLNAGTVNENVKRPRELVAKIDALLLPGSNVDFSIVYSEDMFAMR